MRGRKAQRVGILGFGVEEGGAGEKRGRWRRLAAEGLYNLKRVKG